MRRLLYLDKYLDDAYLAHLPSVRIVHGKGTGALRNAVHTHLKRQKYVKSYHLGEFGEGDAGVTIAEFQGLDTSHKVITLEWICRKKEDYGSKTENFNCR